MVCCGTQRISTLKDEMKQVHADILGIWTEMDWNWTHSVRKIYYFLHVYVCLWVSTDF